MRPVVPLLALIACGPKSEPLTRAELLDPESCADCHPNQTEQWRGSMHAYAGEDPVYLALQAKGQAETDGALGDFCVRCHSPMALSEGATTDGTNLPSVPEHLRGVTCAFCHQVTEVEGDHNNPLKLAKDKVMRGAIRNPLDPGAHVAEYSSLHDGDDLRSAALCGSCHDIVTPLGAHIERTYAEWQDTLFSNDSACGSACHMLGHDDKVADVDGVPVRRRHDHDFAGVDLALTEFPNREDQRQAVQAKLDTTVRSALCVGEVAGSTIVELTLENVSAGHAFPSGASADRRVWIELHARNNGAEVWSSGVVADDEPVTEVEAANPTMWTFHDTLYDLDDQPTHFFWEAADTRGNLLLPTQLGQTEVTANHQTRQWLLQGISVDEVEVAVKIRPMPVDLLDALVASGELDPAVRAALPTFSLGGAHAVWTASAAFPNGDLSCVP